MRIAWANTHGQYPDRSPGESVIHMADVVYDSGGAPRLANIRELMRGKQPDCTIEAQDFRHDDTELVYTCYRERDKADVMGLDIASGEMTTYRKLAGEYNEAEGVSPDGTWALVESSRDQGADRQDFRHIDLWRLTLVQQRRVRAHDALGRLGRPQGVEPDRVAGREWFAFQSARSSDPAGVGYGIFLFRMSGK